MPIVGLTDSPSLPQIGDLRKGAPKPESGRRPGQDLDYFRFESDDPDIAAAFRDEYGEKPRRIDIFLAYEKLDDCFEAWFEEYVAGGLVRRCDGETIYVERDPDEAEYDTAQKPCGQCDCNCKRTGRLHVIIPALERAGEVVVHTTSFHDIRNIYGALQRYQREASRAGLTLDQVPFVLRRRKQMVSTPGGNGRVRREKSLLVLEFAPEWVAERLQQARKQALTAARGDGVALAGRNVPLIEGQATTEGGLQPGAAEQPDVVDVEVSYDDPQQTARRQLQGALPMNIKEAQTAAHDFGFSEEQREKRIYFTQFLVWEQLTSYEDLTPDQADHVVRQLEFIIDQVPSKDVRMLLVDRVIGGKIDVSTRDKLRAVIGDLYQQEAAVGEDEMDELFGGG